jgi:hypothetical protein
MQVMLDVDGDGKITYDEFLSVVKEGMEVERAAIAAGGPGAPAGGVRVLCIRFHNSASAVAQKLDPGRMASVKKC